ncbi:MAG TPA: response regulator [Syntrophorhabdales bacterium]|nr:response regulator [Syntrophorhabdales bacterium]
MEKKVLLIDDEASLRRSVSMGLMQKGYQTEPCENGMKALRTLETFKKKSIPLECAIVDVQLPDIDGLKLLKVIKFNYPQLPVIVITGFGSEVVAEEARAADAYLEKPFSMDDLAKVLAQMEAPAAQALQPEPPVKESKATEQSKSAYALVTLDSSADLLSIYRKLYFHHDVLYCDAIRGDYDLALLLQAATTDEITNVVEKEIRAMEGVADVSLMAMDTPTFGDNVISLMGSVDEALGRDKEENVAAPGQTARTGVSSYVLLETEKEKMEAIYPALYFNDQVVNCDCTQGGFNVVLLVKGTSFGDIDSLIRNKLKTMDGVLRIKEYPIITLFET